MYLSIPFTLQMHLNGQHYAKGEFALSNFHPQNRRAPTMLCTCLELSGGMAITWTHPIYYNDAPQWSD
jgi:hypothetical protein